MSEIEILKTPKPSFETVYEYALESIEFNIYKHADYLLEEHKENIRQEAAIRVWEAYQRLDPDAGWKSFIGLHCMGAVKDYKKAASFEDGIAFDPSGNSDASLHTRIELTTDDGDTMSVEQTAAKYGIFSEQGLDTTEDFEPDWELLSKMAGRDESLMIVGKILLGYSQEEIASQFADDLNKQISRERVSQKIHELFAKMDDPFFTNNLWVNQSIYALGLSKTFHMIEHDNGQGHDLEPFDLNDPQSFKLARRWYQPSLLDQVQEHRKPADKDIEHTLDAY